MLWEEVVESSVLPMEGLIPDKGCKELQYCCRLLEQLELLFNLCTGIMQPCQNRRFDCPRTVLRRL